MQIGKPRRLGKGDGDALREERCLGCVWDGPGGTEKRSSAYPRAGSYGPVVVPRRLGLLPAQEHMLRLIGTLAAYPFAEHA